MTGDVVGFALGFLTGAFVVGLAWVVSRGTSAGER
jgi:hypothetical protein